MTKQTTNAAKTVQNELTEKVTEAYETAKNVQNELTEKVTEAYETATGKLKVAQEEVRELKSVAAASSRATVEGIIEIDRVVLENIRSGLNESLTHGRALISAPSLKVVAEMQQEFATKRLAAVAEQTKALVDLTQAKIQEAWAPLLGYTKTVSEKAVKGKAA